MACPADLWDPWALLSTPTTPPPALQPYWLFSVLSILQAPLAAEPLHLLLPLEGDPGDGAIEDPVRERGRARRPATGRVTGGTELGRAGGGRGVGVGVGGE